MAGMSSKLLLWIHLAPLHTSRMSINMCLPGRRTNILDTAWRGVIEDLLDFLKRLLARFWEQEEDMEEHGYAEDAEDDVDFPSDVCECRWNEVSKCEIECPRWS